MSPYLQFLLLILTPPAIGILLSPFLAKLDKYSKAKRDRADREFFNRNRTQEPKP